MSVRDLVMAAAAAKQSVADLFNTSVYAGTGATSAINNGINLAGHGGLVWLKRRAPSVSNHFLTDTVRGPGQALIANSSAVNQDYGSAALTAFNTNGFTLSSTNGFNEGGSDFVAWTFRKAPRFFDIVAYTGDGNSFRQLPHALGVQPGFIVVKATSTTGNWSAVHRGNNGVNIWSDFQLNSSAQSGQSYGIGSSYTATTFDVTSIYEATGAATTNTLGVSYIAYLFAHDAGADGCIQCGTFTTAYLAGAYSGTVDLGWEPQFVLVRRVGEAAHWDMLDTVRGFASGADPLILASASAVESAVERGATTTTGFTYTDSATSVNTYIYMAIRKP